MALEKEIDFNNMGFNFTYHMVSKIELDKANNTTIITMRSYKDQESREEKKNFETRSFQIENSDTVFSPENLSKKGSNPFMVAYQCLKEFDTFSDSKDI